LRSKIANSNFACAAKSRTATSLAQQNREDMVAAPSVGTVRFSELLHFRGWEAQELVWVLYYFMAFSCIWTGLMRWVDLVGEASFSQRAALSATPTLIPKKSWFVAFVRGFVRFVIWSGVGTTASRIFAELLFGIFALREELWRRLSPDNSRPCVVQSPVGSTAPCVAQQPATVEMAGAQAYQTGSGYQAVQ